MITRKEAKAKKLKKYFTGKACKNGHFSERRTDNGSCCECVSNRNKKTKKLVHLSKRRLIYGAGINDADYQTQVVGYVEGKRCSIWRCPYYVKWKSMLKRAYCQKFHKKEPTYTNCKVCEEWLLFSNFKAWVDKQSNRDWEDKHLDKDFIVVGE